MDRGYTGHEHLQGTGLVHMNGRLYDPVLHRFLAPDNYIQDPFNTQNFNRYGYVLNNPLKYVDISGENYSGTEDGNNGLLYALAAAVSSVVGSWGEEIKNAQIGRWLKKNIVNPIKKLFGGGKKKYVVPSMEFAGVMPSISNLNIAASMPTGIIDGNWVEELTYRTLALQLGFQQGFIAGGKSTWNFIKSLGTAQGWKNVGQGFMNLASMGGYYDPAGGMMLRAQVGMAASNFIDNIPNMSDYEIGYAFGYGVEKLGESALFTRGLGLGTNVVAKGIGNLKIPVYRVYGGGASRFGNYWSPINPKLYGKTYRNFAGLPNNNSGAFLLRGKVRLSDINGFGLTKPLDGNFGRLVPELRIGQSWEKVIWYPGNVSRTKF